MPPIRLWATSAANSSSNDFEVFHEDIKSTPFFGIGVGYQWNSWLRFDATGEYRGKSLFIAQDLYPGGNGTFSVASNDDDGTFLPGTNEYTADIESWVGLANAYIDLPTVWCITPYVGGGIGVASVSVLGLKDVNVPNAGVSYGADHTRRISPGPSMAVSPMRSIRRSRSICPIAISISAMHGAAASPLTTIRAPCGPRHQRHHLARPDVRRALEVGPSDCRADAGRLQVTDPPPPDCQP